MKKKIVILILFVILCVGGCSGNKDYSYEDLNSNQKYIVDTIYDNYSYWKSIKDSGRDIMATKINFIYEDNILLFVVCYDEGDASYDKEYNSGLYFYEIMEVGENGELKEHIYENELFSEKERTNKRKAMMSAINGMSYPANLDEQKDVLANALYKSQENR